MFHVFQLPKYVYNSDVKLLAEEIDLQPNLTFEVLPMQIFDRQDRQLQHKVIPMEKMQLSQHSEQEVT